MPLEQIVIGSFFVVGVLFYIVIIAVSKLTMPRGEETKGNDAVYESGVETYGSPWGHYHAGYFVYALIFVIFDIETAFLYPWAVTFGAPGAGWFVFFEMVLFIGILALGLVYAWKEGALKWR